MIPDFSLQHYRLHLQPKGVLQMPAFNKDNVSPGRVQIQGNAGGEGATVATC